MQRLEDLLGHRFKDMTLLELALTHISASANKKSYERLEFLGDRILSLVVADMLYHTFPTDEEGNLAKRHSALVRQSTLERIGEKISLREFIRVSSRDTPITASMLADALEALLGALYLDGGVAAAQNFIMAHWNDLIDHNHAPPEDGKSALQEWAQARSLPLPGYQVVARTGPDHRPSFVVEVTLTDYPPYQGEGLSKQLAEKDAALQLLTFLRQNHG